METSVSWSIQQKTDDSKRHVFFKWKKIIPLRKTKLNFITKLLYLCNLFIDFYCDWLDQLPTTEITIEV